MNDDLENQNTCLTLLKKETRMDLENKYTLIMDNKERLNAMDIKIEEMDEESGEFSQYQK